MSEPDKRFCESYFLLDPKKASIPDLGRLLFSSDLQKRKFIDSPPEEVLSTWEFRRRWLIFVSVVVQKLLILFRKPLAYSGDLLAFWLNLVHTNGGFLMMLPNLFKGRLVWPRSSSETFASVAGNLDRRVDLDRTMEAGSCRYKAMLCAMASKLSYENEDFVKAVVHNHWKMDFLGFYNFWNGYQKQGSTQAIVVEDTRTDPNVIVVSFRGTDPFDSDDWCTDFDLSWYELKNVGKIHGGFMKALGLQKDGWPKEINLNQSENRTQYAYYTIRQDLRELLQRNQTSKFILTGHSLGGALAILFTAVLVLHDEEQMLERLEGVYTFGQPRVGDEEFGMFMKKVLKKYDVKYERYVYCNDMVPRLPFDDKTLLFKHFGSCLYYDSCYRGKVEEEEPNKNYFNLLWAVPKVLNAVWELIRSFIIPYWEGPEYKEGWFLRCSRVIGLVIPGLPAHFPPEYVNVTRLGVLHLHHQKSHHSTLHRD